MNKFLYLIFIFTITLNSCKTQKNVNKIVFNEKMNQKILVGEITRKGLNKKPFKSWFTKEYENYKPDKASIKHLKNFLPENAKITVVLATWCPDSRREVPRLFKILDQVDFNYDSLNIYAVAKNFKKSGQKDISTLNIKKVPTIIYYHYGYEAGRIIEKPKISIEKDLVEFRKRKGGGKKN